MPVFNLRFEIITYCVLMLSGFAGGRGLFRRRDLDLGLLES